MAQHYRTDFLDSTEPTETEDIIAMNTKTPPRVAVTLSLVPQAGNGPFIFWNDIHRTCKTASELGFSGIELFPSTAREVPVAKLRECLSSNGLALAAVGTGAGNVLQGLSLSDPDLSQRQSAIDFVRAILDLAAEFKCSAIVGSMQGSSTNTETRKDGLSRLVDSLSHISEHATSESGVFLEPLNRYETNLCNTLEDGIEIIKKVGNQHLSLLADLFHMNIEEEEIGASLGAAGHYIGHLHFVDSNRRPAGCGHLSYAPIAAALRTIRYSGWVSAEAFPYPDSTEAAYQTINAYRTYLEEKTHEGN